VEVLISGSDALTLANQYTLSGDATAYLNAMGIKSSDYFAQDLRIDLNYWQDNGDGTYTYIKDTNHDLKLEIDTSMLQMNSADNNTEYWGYSQSETNTNFEFATSGTRNGTEADDIIVVATLNATLNGNGGNDYLYGGTGSNRLYGGDGNDILAYDSNDTVIDGGTGIDFLISEDMTASLGQTNVKNIEVLIKGDEALNLTSLSKLAAIGVTADSSNNTLTLDSNCWTLDSSASTSSDSSISSYTYTGEDANLQLDVEVQALTVVLQTTQG
jgi:Ca2+-binding RTX toxin-like protein